MSELDAIIDHIERKKKELDEADKKLRAFKVELDEGFKQLEYLRLRIMKLGQMEGLDPRVVQLIKEAVDGTGKQR